MKKIFLLALLLALPLAAQTRRNNDSCDVAQFPAATLLLPYFEVDVAAPATNASTTLFTVVNASPQPQIANITLWTDWGYPLLTFQVFLTGYDAQAFNLYDVIERGIIAPTSSGTTRGSRSQTTNPNFAATAIADCANAGGTLPASLLNDVRTALTAGTSTTCGVQHVGGTHTRAVGYATIDLVASCTPAVPNTTAYYDLLLYDNVLTGDYQLVSPNPATGNYAGGNPLVHLRAVPEGGPAGSVRATNLPYTFYDRYTPRSARAMDRRQPLPAAFAARFIQGGTGAFNTSFSIWREGVDSLFAQCSEWLQNSNIPVGDLVRFDERENPMAFSFTDPFLGGPVRPAFPAASRPPSSAPPFPALTTGDVAGWIYLDLNDGGSPSYSNANRASQAWVTVGMAAEGRYSTETNATALANGCSPPRSRVQDIGPGGNVTP